MTLINYIKDFYVNHTWGELLLMLYFIFNVIVTIWACISEDDNVLFFPFMLIIGSPLFMLIWIGELNHKINDKKFRKRIHEEYEFFENPDWLNTLVYEGAKQYDGIHLCRDKKSGLYSAVNTKWCYETKKYETLEEMYRERYRIRWALHL